MKIKFIILKIFFAGILLITSCESYLERTPASEIDEKDIFSTYFGFQGYVDELYKFIVPLIGRSYGAVMDCGDDVDSNREVQQLSGAFPKGNYMFVWTNGGNGNPYRSYMPGSNWQNSETYGHGIWDGGWLGIHDANLGLKNMELLVTATDEEKTLLLGQLYFFRAWLHLEIARSWGGIPYVDEFLEPDADMRFSRLSMEETYLKIAEDFTRAARYLPWDWDETTQGMVAPGKNWGRVTRGMALAAKARAFLYAASPWVEGLKSGAENQYNLALCDSAARAASEVINSARYELVPWTQYYQNFARNDGGYTIIYTKEIIMPSVARVSLIRGQKVLNMVAGRTQVSKRTAAGTSANGITTSPTLNFVNLYETANGLAIEDDPAYDPAHPFSRRDPRFRHAILIDGVKWSKKGMTIELFSEGGSGGGAGLDMAPNPGGSISGFLIKKYLPYGVNSDDKNWNNYMLAYPHIRLPEMYLTYAEAVNEISGPGGTLQGSSLTALEAVNIVRRRVKLPVAENLTRPYELEVYGDVSLPDVNSIYTSSKEVFRERIRNERSIEMAFEAHRWHDIRRWYIAHKPEFKYAYGLAFSKGQTSFRPFILRERIFQNPKHYLLPFKPDDVYLYKEFVQNPGWE